MKPGSWSSESAAQRISTPSGSTSARRAPTPARLARGARQLRDLAAERGERGQLGLEPLADAEPQREPALGMWRFADFLFEVGPGIYFLEPFDPDRIPVLFVHGIPGFPQAFSTLIGALDRERFQAWLHLYPSGLHLDQHATPPMMLMPRGPSRSV